MQSAAITLALMLFAGTAQAQVAASCAAVGAPRALVAPSAIAAPIAPELVAPRHRLGAPTGVLSQALDESLSVDQVLYRIKLAECATMASVTPVPAPGALPVAPGVAPLPGSIDPAAYVPRTEFDNTPWRFDMNQNGKRMTADEFTAWMESKGVRVVKPRAPVAVPASATGVAPGTMVEPAIVPVAPPAEDWPAQ